MKPPLRRPSVALWGWGLITLLLPLLPGVIYLLMGLNMVRGDLRAEAEMGAKSLTRLINRNPDYWYFEQARVREVLTRDTTDPLTTHGWRIMNERGEVVIEGQPKPPWPVLRQDAVLHDFGEPVGLFEITSSFRQFLLKGALLILLGGCAGVFATATLDRTVTRRLRDADRRLRESESKYRQLFRTEVDTILIFDSQSGRFIDVNPAALRMYGYTRKEFLSLTLSDLTAEPGSTSESVRLTLEKGSLQIPFRRHRRKDGTVFPVEISASSFSLGGRKVLCGIVRNISERLLREEDLLRSQRQLRVLTSELASVEERERREIAAVLHDEVGQLLAMCKLQLEPPSAGGSDREARDTPSARRLLETAISRIRELTYELSSQTLYDIGLAEALAELCAVFGERHGLRCSLEWKAGDVGIPQELRGTVYRAVRELLLNVVRHAGATSATVAAMASDGCLHITVQDDGRGFDPFPPALVPTRGGKFGLFNVRERMSYLGGSLGISSVPDGGSKVSLTIPLEREMPLPGP